jgi:hypothetical protein
VIPLNVQYSVDRLFEGGTEGKCVGCKRIRGVVQEAGCWISGEMRVMAMVRLLELDQDRIVKSRKARKTILNQECWVLMQENDNRSAGVQLALNGRFEAVYHGRRLEQGRQYGWNHAIVVEKLEQSRECHHSLNWSNCVQG